MCKIFGVEVCTQKGQCEDNEEEIEDNLDDKFSPILVQLDKMPTWTKEKYELAAKLQKLLKSSRYKEFIGDCRYYYVSRKGQAGIYDVPYNQRGFLSKYQNKRVRIVCMGYYGSHTRRIYFVAPVPRK